MKEPEKNSTNLSSRQQLLLQLLHALGDQTKNRDYQKLLFLYCQQFQDSSYEFVPYKYGAFSFTSYADRRKLIERGLLEQDESYWTLTDDGQKAAQGMLENNRLVLLFAKRFEKMRGDELIAETYRRFPYYATRSEIVDKVLSGDTESLKRIQNVQPTPGPYALSTIGYEGHSLESYLNRLLKAGITLLCDVRRNPISRKYGFSKKTLSNACDGVGIRYEHLPELGIPSDQRQELETQADYDALFELYEREILINQTDSINIIKEWTAAGEKVALTCYEHLPEQCHRHCVSDRLQATFGSEFTPKHL